MGRLPTQRIQSQTVSALFDRSEDLQARSETLQHEANRLSEYIRELDHESARIVATCDSIRLDAMNGLVGKP